MSIDERDLPERAVLADPGGGARPSAWAFALLLAWAAVVYGVYAVGYLR